MRLPAPDPAFRWNDEPWGPALCCRPLASVAQHLLSSRQLGLPAADGWTRLADSLGVPLDGIKRIRQVHGRAVQVWRRGAGIPADPPEADSHISNDPSHVLAVQVADCVPILIADAGRSAAAAVHAGWRGLAARIPEHTIGALAREFGSRPGDLIVAVGPSIGACCYDVGEELVDAFRSGGASSADLARWFLRDAEDRLRLDLWTTARDQLINAGVPAGQISVARLCTQSHVAVFESFRAEGPRAGRMAAAIRVPAHRNPQSLIPHP